MIQLVYVWVLLLVTLVPSTLVKAYTPLENACMNDFKNVVDVTDYQNLIVQLGKEGVLSNNQRLRNCVDNYRTLESIANFLRDAPQTDVCHPDQIQKIVKLAGNSFIRKNKFFSRVGFAVAWACTSNIYLNSQIAFKELDAKNIKHEAAKNQDDSLKKLDPDVNKVSIQELNRLLKFETPTGAKIEMCRNVEQYYENIYFSVARLANIGFAWGMKRVLYSQCLDENGQLPSEKEQGFDRHYITNCPRGVHLDRLWIRLIRACYPLLGLSRRGQLRGLSVDTSPLPVKQFEHNKFNLTSLISQFSQTQLDSTATIKHSKAGEYLHYMYHEEDILMQTPSEINRDVALAALEFFGPFVAVSPFYALFG